MGIGYVLVRGLDDHLNGRVKLAPDTFPGETPPGDDKDLPDLGRVR